VLQPLRAVASLLLGAGILILGNGLVGITLPIRMGVEGLPTAVSGIVMSAYYAGLVAGSIYGQTIIRGVGHIRAFAAFAGLLTAATLGFPLWFDPLPWGVLRGVSGFCMAGLFATIESWLNVRSSNETRGRILSFYMVVAYLASGSGQLLVNAWGVTGVELFCLAALVMSLALVPIVLTRVSAPDTDRIRPLSFRQLYLISPLGVAGAFGAGLVGGGFYGMGAIFASEIGLTVFQISIFMGVAVFGGFLLQWPIGRLSDRFDRRTVLLVMLLVTVCVCVALYAWSMFGTFFAPTLVLIGLFGGAASTIYPISLAHAFDYVERERMVAASSGMLLAWAVGATAGPLLASLVMQVLDPSSLFLYLATVGLLLAGFARYRMSRRAPRPSDEQAAFVPMPVTTAEVKGELDPRASAPVEIIPPGAPEPADAR
jgi:MFS family permease